MARATVEQTRKANWLELFYDLVFAAAVITFSDAVSHNPEPEVIGIVSASFVAVWLIWLATTFYVNVFGIDDTLHRILIVVQMLLLTLVSLTSWYWIFRKAFAIHDAKAKTDKFERDFWSGGDLNGLYQSAVNNRHETGALERIFEAGYREFSKLRS